MREVYAPVNKPIVEKPEAPIKKKVKPKRKWKPPVNKKYKDKRGGARPGAGRKKDPDRVPPKNTTISIDPRFNLLARKRHGSLAKALKYAAFNGGIDPEDD